MKKHAFSLLGFLLLLSGLHVQGLFTSDMKPDHLISDGILPTVHRASSFHLSRPSSSSSSSSSSCEPTYGFLPCTTTVLGNLFLMVVYGYLMFLGATYLSAGSELLLQVLGPGIIGGLFLPVLGSLPDALLILVSGLSGSKETAQDQVSIGMGLLAGSTVMLLTYLWGSCVVVGKCDLSADSTSIDSQDSKRCSLTGSGVTTDLLTSYAARIMVISVIPFIIVQLQTFFSSSSAKRITILVSLILSVVFLLSYCLFQVFQPWLQERRLEYVKLKLVMSSIVKSMQKERDALGLLLNEDGKPNIPLFEKIFQSIDQDSNGYISILELRALIVGLDFDRINMDRDEAIKIVLNDFDTSGDFRISMQEFVKGLSKWLNVAKRSVPNRRSYSRKFVDAFEEMAREEYAMLTDTADDVVENVAMLTDKADDVVENVASKPLVWFKAVSLLLLGTVIAAAFADPLVDVVDNFSSATGINSFFISFVAMPLVSNSSEAVTAIIFASRKTQTTTSLTFSEIYGAATMNNTLCLAVFLALVYFRDLTWDFSAEVLVILIVCIVMGLFASFCTTFQLWTCFLAYLLYPLSLGLVYVLDYCFGWS